MEGLDALDTYRLTMYVRCPRWWGLKQLLFSLAYHCEVQLKITEHDKGWVFQTIYFTADGTKEHIDTFDRALCRLNKAL